MKYKKLISLFLFLVMSIQVLPLQQIAAWLSSGQVTEEIAHGVKPLQSKPAPGETDPPFEFHAYSLAFHSRQMTGLSNHPQDEDLQLRHADDILFPPPNC